MLCLSWIACIPARAASMVEFGVDALQVAEGGFGYIPISVSSWPETDIRIRVVVAGGTATTPDYSLPREILSIRPGHEFIEFFINDDGFHEVDETLKLQLQVIAGALPGARTNLAVTLRNLVPTLKILPSNGSENFGALFQVYRRGDTNLVVTADWATTGEGTAQPGVDYQPAAGTVTFPAGERVMELKIPWTDNGLVNLPQTLAVRLSNPSPGAVIDEASAITRVADNEIPATLDFRAVAAEEFPASVAVISAADRPDGGLFTVQQIDRLDGQEYEYRSILLTYDPTGKLTGLAELPVELSMPPALLADAQGGVYLCSYFESVEGHPFPGLVRLRSNGMLDQRFYRAIQP